MKRPQPFQEDRVMYAVDEEEEEEEEQEGMITNVGEKKRRLRTEQVRALEMSFEEENKLEPERKLRLARDLGLQPRQVAVWFQNRRARWKTKQLERDFVALRADHDALERHVDALRRDNDALLADIKVLKAKLKSKEKSSSVKEEKKVAPAEEERTPAIMCGPSESDSSVVMNDKQHELLIFGSNSSSSGFLNYQHQLVKMEEQPEFEEPCSSSFFNDEQAPSLSWCCSEWS